MSYISLDCRHLLFDWGGTLMVDLPGMVGPMCDWPSVLLVDGAKACLERLSRQVSCHLATNAVDSNEMQIRSALQRGGIADYIDQVFCAENLHCHKPSPRYFRQIVAHLQCRPSEIVLVGDHFETDVLGALASGRFGLIPVIWINRGRLWRFITWMSWFWRIKPLLPAKSYR